MDYRLVRQSTGWLYLIFHPAFHVTYRLLFRKIYLHNRSGVKAQTPVLIASNHPTAFVDPILFCIFFDPPVYNMTRGDIFRKWFFRKVMESVNMFPVFRRRDGYNERDRNDEVFDYCANKMKDRVTVNIFIEGQHHLDKRLLPPQKGIARIAFGTYEKYRLEDLQITPVGVSYIYGDRSRDEVSVITGEPIFIRDYWEAYQQAPAATVNKLCKDIEVALRKLCYHIEDPADDPMAAQLLEMGRSEQPGTLFPVVEHRARRFFVEKAMLERLNSLDIARKTTLKTALQEYFGQIESAGISDEALTHPTHGSFIRLAFLIISAPIALIGFVLSWPVRRVAHWVARKTVKKPEFYTSVQTGVATIFGLLYFLTLLFSGWFANIVWLPPLALLLPQLTWLSIYWKETLQRRQKARKAADLPEKQALLNLREKIRKLIDE